MAVTVNGKNGKRKAGTWEIKWKVSKQGSGE
jgi:hypothetical protein